jgi:hypothetical protein
MTSQSIKDSRACIEELAARYKMDEAWYIHLLYKAGMDLLNNATCVYGPAIFSSLTMVSGHNAIKILCVYGGIAILSRIAAVWVLEAVGDSD